MTTVMTLASIPAILALVQLAKSFGVQGKWSTLLAVVLGVVLQVGDAAFLSGAATPAEWYAAVGTGLILGLSAAGLYDAARVASNGVVSAAITGTPTAPHLTLTVPTVPEATAPTPEPGTGDVTPRAPGGVTSVPRHTATREVEGPTA